MGERKKRRTCSPVGSAGRLRPPPGLSLTPSVPPPASYSPDLMPPSAPYRHRPPSRLSPRRGGRTLGTERKKGGLSKAEERQSHTLAATAASERVRGRAVCVCLVCASEAWWSGCRSQGSTGSGVRWGPRAAPAQDPRDYNSQNAACPGGWNREEEEKGGSKQEREGRKLGAGSREGGRAKSPGDTGRGGEEEGITARTEPIRRGRRRWLKQAGQRARLPGKAEELYLRGCKSPTPPPSTPLEGRG